MKTNRLYVYALLVLLTGGCATRNYGPNSPDYYPDMLGVSWLHVGPGVPPKVAAAYGSANLCLCTMPRDYDHRWNLE